MTFTILNRFSGEVQITAEIDCDESVFRSLKLGLAVKWAIKNNADLRSANLSYADLSYADLRSANLSYADLSYADLRSANLSYADLSYANLRSADLRSANLSSLRGCKWAQVAFHSHGECGRQLSAVVIDGSTVFFCGCFKGSREQLEGYIANGKEDLRVSRTKAMAAVISLLDA